MGPQDLRVKPEGSQVEALEDPPPSRAFKLESFGILGFQGFRVLGF